MSIRKDWLLAGAIGDAVGYIVEFYRLEKILQFWPEGLQLSAIPEDRTLYVSDDTQMTLFTIEAIKDIKNNNTMPTKAYQNAFKQWYYTQEREYDKTTGLATFSSMRQRRAPGSTCLSALASNVPVAASKGCGGIMRAAPCAFFSSIKESFAEGAKQAAITHGHPSGYLPAGFLAGLIHILEDCSVSLNMAIELNIEELKNYPQHEETLEHVELAVKLSQNKLPYEDIPIIGQGWTGEEALGIALYTALTAKSFEECISIAINHDGDSDSTGSIAAQIFAATYGLPEKYKSWASRLDIADAWDYCVTDDIEVMR